MKYHMDGERPSVNKPMLSERQRLSPLYLPIGLGLIMLVSGCAWAIGGLLA